VSVFISVFFPLRQRQELRQSLLDEARVVARIMAYSSEAGLNFGDASAVQQVLSSLGAVKDVEFALVVDGENKPFADYKGEAGRRLVPRAFSGTRQSASGAEAGEEGRLLLVREPIVSSGVRIGDILVGFSQQSMSNAVARSARTSVLVGVSVLILGGLLFAWFASQIVNPLRSLEKAAKRISKGDVDVSVEVRTTDEIGALADSFRDLTDYFKGVARVSEALNRGDLSAEVAVRSERDVLSKNFLALRSLMEEMRHLIRCAEEGQLATRGTTERFTGVYRELVQAVNQMMDAIVKPLQEAASVLGRISQRDLRARMRGTYRGDYAALKEVLDIAVNHLDDGLRQVAVSSRQVAQAASEISAGTQALAQGGSEQAHALEETAIRLKELVAAIAENAGFAEEGRELSEKALLSSNKGVDSMERLSRAIDQIKTASDQTAKIVKTIDEIAFQTNLLALNAAVEAARAGDAGRGFAVVADEVRGLAMRSAQAAKHTAGMIEECVRSAEAGVSLNREALQDFEEIDSHVRQVVEMMARITAASSRQNRGVDQITAALERMDQISRQNAATSEQSAAASEELNSQAELMRELVATFRLSSDGGERR
jgi:methyl-accepting chemotaxis protein